MFSLIQYPTRGHGVLSNRSLWQDKHVFPLMNLAQIIFIETLKPNYARLHYITPVHQTDGQQVNTENHKHGTNQCGCQPRRSHEVGHEG